ncbi:fumarylacetoacetate hydrolase family protein [Rhizobium leguminosarum]
MIMTGTPQGVGPVQPGDTIDVQIEAIGELSISVGRAAS